MIPSQLVFSSQETKNFNRKENKVKHFGAFLFRINEKTNLEKCSLYWDGKGGGGRGRGTNKFTKWRIRHSLPVMWVLFLEKCLRTQQGGREPSTIPKRVKLLFFGSTGGWGGGQGRGGGSNIIFWPRGWEYFGDPWGAENTWICFGLSKNHCFNPFPLTSIDKTHIYTIYSNTYQPFLNYLRWKILKEIFLMGAKSFIKFFKGGGARRLPPPRLSYFAILNV